MAGYLVVSLFSILYLSGSVLSTTYWLYDRVFIPMCLYLIVRLVAPNEAELKHLAAIAFAICGAQALVGTLSWIAPSVLPSMWRGPYIGDRTVGTLVNPGVFTQTLAFCSLLVLHAGLNHESRVVRLMYIGGFLAGFYCIFISFTRSSWLAALVVGLGMIFLYPKFMLRVILVSALVVGGLGGVLLAQQLDMASQRLVSEQSEESALSRLPVYYAAYRMFMAKPLFGWGYSNFDRYDREFQARVGDLVNAAKDHASHNLYLTILAEQGLTGILLYLAPLFWWFFRSLKAQSRMPSAGFWSRKLLATLWLAVAFFVIINNFFNTMIVYSLGLWWIMLALIATVVDRQFDEQPQVYDLGEDPLVRLYQEAKP
jgi:O-antigen ligase